MTRCRQQVCYKLVTSRCNGIWETTRHNRLLPAPTCYRPVTDLQLFATINTNKIVIKILQGSVVTQTVLGGLAIYLLLATFLHCICAKCYENWLAVDKVIAIKKGALSMAHIV